MSTVTTDDNETIVTTEGSTEEIIEQLVDVVNQQSKQIEQLQDELEQEKDDRRSRAKKSAEDRQRLSDVEQRLDDVEDSHEPYPSEGENTDTSPSITPESGLEQTVALPEGMVEQESANVQRAVFLARDVKDYTRDCPAGRVITSGDIGRVLRAGTDCQGRSQTVDRVMKILDDLGGDDIEIIERRGERRVIFTDELCHRLNELGTNPQTSNTVVTEGEV